MSDDTPTPETDVQPDGDQTTPQTPVEPPQSDDTEQTDHTPDPAAQLAEITAERDQLAAQVLRLTVAADTGVPADLLHGATEDELRASAARLAEYAKSAAPVDYGPRETRQPAVSRPVDPVRNQLRRL